MAGTKVLWYARESYTVKAVLVSALSACAPERRHKAARRFLEGLSGDELQYIAGYLGSFILERGVGAPGSPGDWMGAFERTPPRGAAALDDRDHKMIVLMEYLGRCGLNQPAMVVPGGHS